MLLPDITHYIISIIGTFLSYHFSTTLTIAPSSTLQIQWPFISFGIPLDQPSDSSHSRAPSQQIVPLRPKRAPAPALLQKFAGWFEINEPRVLNCTAMKSMASPNCCAHLGRLARPDFGTCQVDDSSENRVPSKSNRFVIIIPMERAIFGRPIPRGFPEPCNLVHLKYGKTKRRISW